MIDVYVTPGAAGETVTATGTAADERFIISEKFDGYFSVVIKAGAGDDQISDDSLKGSFSLTMGDGADIANVSGGGANIGADMGGGNDTFTGGADIVCHVSGGAGDDTLDCSGEGVLVYGGEGADVIRARNTRYEGMTVDGGPGNDRITAYVLAEADLNGGDGDDLIEFSFGYIYDDFFVYGGAGADTIRYNVDSCGSDVPIDILGGPGRDRLYAGVCLDRFHLTPANTPRGAGRDTVFGLKDGADRLVVEGDADKRLPGTQRYQFVGKTKSPTPGTVGWYSATGGPVVVGNDGRTIFEVKLSGFKGLVDAGDFQL